MKNINKKLLVTTAIVSVALFLVLAVSIVGVIVNWDEETKLKEESKLKEGTYTSMVEGFDGPFEVTTVVDKNGEIVDIIVGENSETEGLGGIAIEKLPELIKEQQSLDVDGVAGASITVAGILKSVGSSIEEAGGNLIEYGMESEG